MSENIVNKIAKIFWKYDSEKCYSTYEEEIKGIGINDEKFYKKCAHEVLNEMRNLVILDAAGNKFDDNMLNSYIDNALNLDK